MQSNKFSTVHILMCGDAGYFQHIAACLVSLLDHNPHMNFSVVVLVTKTTTELNEKLQLSLAQYRNLKIDIIRFNPPGFAELPLASGYYPMEIYARFWVADYFPADVDRVLYLDGDMVIVGDITPLIELDFKGNMLAAVQIPGSIGPQVLGYPDKFGYFNSGVLVFNMIRWRTENVNALLVKTAFDLREKLNDPDQDVLNYCFHAQYIALDYVWNAISPFFKGTNSAFVTEEQARRAVLEPRIVHFNGKAKPWNYLSTHPYTGEYLRCVAKTEWRDFQPIGYSHANFLKKRIIATFGERRTASAVRFVRSVFARGEK